MVNNSGEHRGVNGVGHSAMGLRKMAHGLKLMADCLRTGIKDNNLITNDL